MNAEQLARIFDKFYRADASNRAVGGIGLGMSIAKSIVEAHGGEIRVRSRPGHGTSVAFTLPMNVDVPSAESQGGDSPSP
jgi:signal transduction histidine kinase